MSGKKDPLDLDSSQPRKGVQKKKGKTSLSSSKMVESFRHEMASMTQKIDEHSEALNGLKDVPKTLEEISDLIQKLRKFPVEDTNEFIDEEESSTKDSDSFNPEDTIDALLAKSQVSSQAETADIDQNADLAEILNMTQSPPDYGKELNNDIAQSLSRLSSQKPKKETVDLWRELYKPPINCKTLGVPRINKEIWPLLPQKTRQCDFSHQQIQQLNSMAAVALSRIAESVFTAGKKLPDEYSRELLKLSMEASSILGMINQELNLKRKLEIKI